jgi:hypothetical protein
MQWQQLPASAEASAVTKGAAMLSSEIANTAEISAATHAAVTQACTTIASAASRTVCKEGKQSGSKSKAGEVCISSEHSRGSCIEDVNPDSPPAQHVAPDIPDALMVL